MSLADLEDLGSGEKRRRGVVIVLVVEQDYFQEFALLLKVGHQPHTLFLLGLRMGGGDGWGEKFIGFGLTWREEGISEVAQSLYCFKI